jgi:hypothetical protein
MMTDGKALHNGFFFAIAYPPQKQTQPQKCSLGKRFSRLCRGIFCFECSNETLTRAVATSFFVRRQAT